MKNYPNCKQYSTASKKHGGFRHVVRNVYTYNLSEKKLAPLFRGDGALEGFPLPALNNTAFRLSGSFCL